MKKLLIGLVVLSSFTAMAESVLVDASCKAKCTGTISTGVSRRTGVSHLRTVGKTVYVNLSSMTTKEALDGKADTDLLEECKSQLKKDYVSGLQMTSVKANKVNCLYLKSR